MEQPELLADAAVIALLGLFQPLQVLLELLLVAPGRTVNPLQHFVVRIAAPVGPGQLGQLERAQLAGRRHVRPAAQVDEIALAVQRKRLAGRNVGDDLGLVFLALVAEERNRLVARQFAALDRQVLVDDALHFGLDRLEVVRMKGLFAREIVVKPVLDGRPDRHLGVRVQPLDRLGHQVRGRMPDHLHALVVAGRDDAKAAVALDPVIDVDQPAVELAGQRRLGKPRPDIGRDLAYRHRLGKRFPTAVGKHDFRHECFVDESLAIQASYCT